MRAASLAGSPSVSEGYLGRGNTARLGHALTCIELATLVVPHGRRRRQRRGDPADREGQCNERARREQQGRRKRFGRHTHSGSLPKKRAWVLRQRKHEALVRGVAAARRLLAAYVKFMATLLTLDNAGGAGFAVRDTAAFRAPASASLCA